MEDLIGKQLGPYQLVKQMGEGGMATVYKAYQASMDRYVALKILPRHFANDPQFSQRFIQEAKVIAKLEHPNILPVHDFGNEDDYTFLVMRLIEGGALSDLMNGDPLSFKEINRLISQVGSALDYAHRHGVIHRDIKPANILIDQLGNCLLTDFGVAKMVEGSTNLTKTGGILGTPAYISPEQGMGQKIDHRSDIYSLGVILYQMVVGILPYNAETPMAVVIKHIHDPLPPPRQRCPTMPESIEQVILKTLAKNPLDRFDTAGTLVTALDKAVNSLPEAGEETMANFAPQQPSSNIAQTKSMDGATIAPPSQQHNGINTLPGEKQKKSWLIPAVVAILTATFCLGTVYLYSKDLLPDFITGPFTEEPPSQQPIITQTTPPPPVPDPAPAEHIPTQAPVPHLPSGEYKSVMFFNTETESDHKFTHFFLDASQQNSTVVIHSTELIDLQLAPETSTSLQFKDGRWTFSLPIRAGEHQGKSLEVVFRPEGPSLVGTVEIRPKNGPPEDFTGHFVASSDPAFDLLAHNPFQPSRVDGQTSMHQTMPIAPVDRMFRPDAALDLKLMLLFHNSEPTATVTFNGNTIAAQQVSWVPEKHPSLEFHFEHHRGSFHLSGDLFRPDPEHSAKKDFILLGHIDTEKKMGKKLKRREFDFTLRLPATSDELPGAGEWLGWAVSLTPQEDHLAFIGEAAAIKKALRTAANKGALIMADPAAAPTILTITKIKRAGNLWIARADGTWYLLLESSETPQKVMVRSHGDNTYIGLKPFTPRPEFKKPSNEGKGYNSNQKPPVPPQKKRPNSQHGFN